MNRLLKYQIVYLAASSFLLVDNEAFVLNQCPNRQAFAQSSTLRPVSSRSAEFSVPAQNVPDIETTKRTLYQVLGASPNATRAELKQNYVVLAKQSHPDAIMHGTKSASSSTINSPSVDFTEIAAAWRILSDPKQRLRYDRSLQAEQFTNDVQEWASRMSKQAAPAAKKFGQVAIPFLRKTTAATFASIQAAANDLSRKAKARQEQVAEQSPQNDLQQRQTHVLDHPQTYLQQHQSQQAQPSDELQPNQSISTSFNSAMETARRANRYVNSLYLQEKSQVLEERALHESEQAAELERQLQVVAGRRLIMALHTPGSGLTSAEALILWEEFNKTVGDSLTAWDRALMKHTIEYEIQELQECERIFMEAQAQDSQAQLQYQMSMQLKLRAKKGLVDAENAEIKARQELERAEQAVVDARETVDESAQKLANAEAFARKCDYEMEKRSLALVRQSEKVRSALRGKERESMEQNNDDDIQIVDQVSAERLKELKELRREERLLAQDSARLESKAARLFSRANKLKIRAAELEKVNSS